jgi:hypothetical protein
MNELKQGDIVRISSLIDVCNLLTQYKAGQEVLVVVKESNTKHIKYELNGQISFLFLEHLENDILTYESFFGTEKFLYQKVELKNCPFLFRIKYKLKKLLKLL